MASHLDYFQLSAEVIPTASFLHDQHVLGYCEVYPPTISTANNAGQSSTTIGQQKDGINEEEENQLIQERNSSSKLVDYDTDNNDDDNDTDNDNNENSRKYKSSNSSGIDNRSGWQDSNSDGDNARAERSSSISSSSSVASNAQQITTLPNFDDIYIIRIQQRKMNTR